MRSPGSLEEKLHVRDRFLAVLKTAATQRKRRPALVPAPGGGGGGRRREPEWVTFERQVMADAVDAERIARGLAVADPRRLRGAESAAVGHIDYMEKFALYCAEIALGDSES